MKTRCNPWAAPARLFRLAFAGSIPAALAIGFLVEDERPLCRLPFANAAGFP
jgi:hypothetical protein